MLSPGFLTFVWDHRKCIKKSIANYVTCKVNVYEHITERLFLEFKFFFFLQLFSQEVAKYNKKTVRLEMLAEHVTGDGGEPDLS